MERWWHCSPRARISRQLRPTRQAGRAFDLEIHPCSDEAGSFGRIAKKNAVAGYLFGAVGCEFVPGG